MKSIFALFAFVFLFAFNVQSQTLYTVETHPLDYWAGEWVQKTTEITPAPKSDTWKAQVVLNRFEPILGGEGLYRQAFTDSGVVEAYFFLDSGVGKLYGMSIDENGFVWQTESKLMEDGGISLMIGAPINDKALRIESRLKRVDENNVEFTQDILENNKKIQTIKGVFIRVPGY